MRLVRSRVRACGGRNFNVVTVPAVVHQRKIARKRNGAYTGNFAGSGADLLVSSRPLVLFETVVSEIRPHARKAMRVETGSNIFKIADAAETEADANHDESADSNFERDQRTAEDALPFAADGTFAAERSGKIRNRSVQSGSKSSGEACKKYE